MRHLKLLRSRPKTINLINQVRPEPLLRSASIVEPCHESAATTHDTPAYATPGLCITTSEDYLQSIINITVIQEVRKIFVGLKIEYPLHLSYLPFAFECCSIVTFSIVFHWSEGYSFEGNKSYAHTPTM